MKAASILPWLALAALGCGADSGSKTAGPTGGSVSTGTKTNTNTSYDAGAFSRDSSVIILPNSDAGSSRDGSAIQMVGVDAPIFKWDGGVNAGTGGSKGTGGTTGNTGGSSAGVGGTTAPSGGFISSGGTTASGGRTGAGGSSSTGGIFGTGGSTTSAGTTAGSGGMTSANGGVVATGGVLRTGGASVTLDAAVPRADALVGVSDAGRNDAAWAADAGAAKDTAPSGADSASACVAKLLPMVPVSLNQLTASAGRKVVLRAEASQGGTPIAANWSWEGYNGASSLPYQRGDLDTSQVAFPIQTAGYYQIRAFDRTTSCSAQIAFAVHAVNECYDCDHRAIVQAAAPSTTGIPVQRLLVKFVGSPPYSDSSLLLNRGVEVKLAPSVASNVVNSYVRVLSPANSNFLVDGVADQMHPFSTRLLEVFGDGDLLNYHVLVVPLDGQDGGTIGATAPQLFQNLTPSAINGTPFKLSGSTAVTGTLSDPEGAPVADARIVFTNQAPGTDQSLPTLLFSSVGRASSTGAYRVNVQPTSAYFATATPPAGSGLVEAMSASAIVLAGATVDFVWDRLPSGSATLRIVDALSNPVAGARIRLTAAPKVVGKFRVSAGGGVTEVDGNGNLLVEATTSTDGVVTFDDLPVGARYSVAIVPQPLSSLATSTTATFTLGASSTDVVLRAQAQTVLEGVLSSPLADADLSRVVVWAYDKSPVDPEDTRQVPVQASGKFAVSVTPGRPYVLLAVPPVDSGMARTFVGPGAMVATEFPVSQTMPSRMDYRSVLIDDTGASLAGTALQAFCQATWPSCVDDTIPIAETTSLADGSFRLALPDPATR